MIVRMVWVSSQGDQSSITFGGGEEACQVIKASLIGTFTARVNTKMIRVARVATAVKSCPLLSHLRHTCRFDSA